ncbi:MAG: 4a-hydroxytetrahydrobiopterin dehydratase [Mycobacteriales bacterium]
MRTPLTAAEIAAQTPEGWYVEQGKLTTRRELPSFPEAIAFVQRVAELAEELDHHPDIDIRWRTVVLAVNTHDAGGAITGKDIELARRVGAL